MIAGARSKLRIVAIAAAAVVLCLGVFLCSIGSFDSSTGRFTPSDRARSPYVAVVFSGDMGLRYGKTPYLTAALHGVSVPVVAFSSPAEFTTGKSRTDVDAFVAGAIRDALARTRARAVILIGQSFGADIARVGLADLPGDLRSRIATAILVVPGLTAYFHVDPSGLTYVGTPDAGPAEAATIDWLPVLCIHGAAEIDSLCPALRTPNVRSVSLPGGHHLDDDNALLVRTVVTALTPLLSGRR